jgi:PPM family protein phosphatase
MIEIYRGQRPSRLYTAKVTITLPLQESMLDVEFAHISDPGRVRTGNEDYLGQIIPETPEQGRTHGWLFALADGVGGHAQGEVASQAAVESLLEGFRAARSGESPPALMQRLVQMANARVFQAGLDAGASGAGMATTLVACALRHDRAIVAHVGDSRCYLIRDGQAKALTRDHTVANEHVKLGLLSEDEVAEAETRHVLTRSMGGGLFVGVEINDQQVLAGDVLLLCSDGLHGSVGVSDMAEAIGQGGNLHEAAQRLVALANERDGGDNISVQLIRVRSVERVGMYRGRPYKLR